uniref:Putative hydroxylase n=1 Tax=Taxus baccata TaxID=25629 RepID=A0A0F7DHA0_TAXBA|nr:putative hydroxylase [Taxus baccata]
MSVTIVVWVVVICILLVKRPYRKGHNFYGPKSYPLLGCLISFWKNQSRLCEWYTDLLRESPTQTITVQRVGAITTVVTANPENVEHILKTRFDNYPKGKIFKAILHDLLGNGIFNADGVIWRMQRKIAGDEFNTKSLRNFIVDSVQTEITERLLPLLLQACQKGSFVDLQDVLRRFSFDNICKVAFGMDPNCLDLSLRQSDFANAFDLASHLSSKRALSLTSLEWRVKRALNLGSERLLADALRVVHDFATEIIRGRSAEVNNLSPQDKPDLLSRFVALAKDDVLDEQYLRDIVVSFVLAGRDTTASALTWFFWLLSSHPKVEEAILKEINDEYDSGLQDSYENMKGMQYLHAALCESMRLYPPVRYDSKYALEDDFLPDGTFVRKGSWVTYHPYAMGRMDSIWGADCMEFDPDRWMEDGVFVPQSPFKFAVFQAGARICLGREMAFIQMKYIAISVIRRFRLRVDPQHKADSIPSLSASMKNGLPVRVERREASSSPPAL